MQSRGDWRRITVYHGDKRWYNAHPSVYKLLMVVMVRVLKLLLIVGAAVVVTGARENMALQVPVSPTPVSISLPSPLPFAAATQAGPTTATPTRTPTPIGPAMLQAITEANVRAEPDPDAERLGTIRAGDMYPVMGRYFRWLQFQYDSSPSGTGWVFDELVEIIGDESAIRDLSVEAAPTTDPLVLAQTATTEAILLSPGGDLTATANARVISIPAPPLPGMSGDTGSSSVESSAEALSLPVETVLLPTFTFPPNIVAATPTDALAVALAVTPTSAADALRLPTTSSVPPIVPILVLGALGVLGLAVSSFRR